MDGMKDGGAGMLNPTVVVRGQTYTLRKEEMSEHHLYGYREKTSCGGGTEIETTWVVRSEKYITVAVALDSRNEACESLMHEIYRYLLTVTTYSQGER